MVQVFLQYCNRILTPDDKDWTMNEKFEWRKAKCHMVTELICQVDVIVAHPNAFGIDKIRKNFAKKLAGTERKFMVAMEECSALTELDTVMFARMSELDTCKCVILCGDEQQANQSVSSGHLNEHGHQIKLSMFGRLVLGGFPTTTLYKNFRSTSTITDFPSQRSYDGIMVANEANDVDLKADAGLTACIKEYFAGNAIEDASKFDYIFIKVANSSVAVNDDTKIRYNLSHLKCSTGLMAHIIKRGVAPKSLALTCEYTAHLEQCQLITNTWAAENHVPFSFLPTFLTTAVVQGEQYDYVIYDNVISKCNSLADLSITVYEAQRNFLRSSPRQKSIAYAGQ